MGNASAFPIWTVLERLPVIKTRALTEEEANQDGLARTCYFLATQFPELWVQIWRASSNKRVWQELIPVSIILKTSEYDVLADRILWLKEHPHPRLKCHIAIHRSETKKRSLLMRDFKKDIEEGYLSLVICDCCVESDQALLQLLADADTDWVVMSTNDLWSDVCSLQLQLRRLAEQPAMQIVEGTPKLWRRDVLFDTDQLNDFKADAAT